MSIQILKQLLARGRNGMELLQILEAITPKTEPQMPIIEPFVDVMELGWWDQELTLPNAMAKSKNVGASMRQTMLPMKCSGTLANLPLLKII